MWLLKTGDPLIEVSTEAGLIVLTVKVQNIGTCMSEQTV